MRPIPQKLKQEIINDQFYKICIREKTHNCGGRITWEHAIIFAGKQINEKWAILPVCERHHGVNSYQDRGDIDKRFHEWMALTRLFNSDEAYQEEQKKKYLRAWPEWERKYKYLNKIYEGKRHSTNIQE
ncbi:MAG: hypothetical protein RBT65_15760 [Methanolobus sp.]|nr:hypothetical protein [Methanolobus sp.]